MSHLRIGKGAAWEWAALSAGTSSGSGGRSMNAKCNANGDVRCTPEALDQFLRALKADLEKTAKESGVAVSNASDVLKDGRLEGFRFDYTNGTVANPSKTTMNSVPRK